MFIRNIFNKIDTVADNIAGAFMDGEFSFTASTPKTKKISEPVVKTPLIIKKPTVEENFESKFTTQIKNAVEDRQNKLSEDAALKKQMKEQVLKGIPEAARHLEIRLAKKALLRKLTQHKLAAELRAKTKLQEVKPEVKVVVEPTVKTPAKPEVEPTQSKPSFASRYKVLMTTLAILAAAAGLFAFYAPALGIAATVVTLIEASITVTPAIVTALTIAAGLLAATASAFVGVGLASTFGFIHSKLTTDKTVAKEVTVDSSSKKVLEKVGAVNDKPVEEKKTQKVNVEARRKFDATTSKFFNNAIKMQAEDKKLEAVPAAVSARR